MCALVDFEVIPVVYKTVPFTQALIRQDFFLMKQYILFFEILN